MIPQQEVISVRDNAITRIKSTVLKSANESESPGRVCWNTVYLMWRLRPATPALRRYRQEHYKFEVSLTYVEKR